MTRKNEKRLLPSKAHTYGAKAKAAIVAGTVALALIPTPAFAIPHQMGSEQGQPAMEQPMQGEDAPNTQEPSFQQPDWQGEAQINVRDWRSEEDAGERMNDPEQFGQAPNGEGDQQQQGEHRGGDRSGD